MLRFATYNSGCRAQCRGLAGSASPQLPPFIPAKAFVTAHVPQMNRQIPSFPPHCFYRLMLIKLLLKKENPQMWSSQQPPGDSGWSIGLKSSLTLTAQEEQHRRRWQQDKPAGAAVLWGCGRRGDWRRSLLGVKTYKGEITADFTRRGGKSVSLEVQRAC